MYCIKCGSENNSDALFCQKCGCEIKQNQNQAEKTQGVTEQQILVTSQLKTEKQITELQERKRRKKIVVAMTILLVVVLAIGGLGIAGFVGMGPLAFFFTLEEIGLFPAKDDDIGTWGYIDAQGDWVIEPQFAGAGLFSEGLAQVSDSKTELSGYIDIKGNWVIDPQFTLSSPFSEGLAQVLDYQTGMIGYIDKEGNWAIEPQFSDSGMEYGEWSRYHDLNLGAFSEGLAVMYDSTSGYFGYIDTNGSWAIRPQFQNAMPFSEGLALVKDPVTNNFGYINTYGRWAIEPQSQYIPTENF